MVLMCILIPLLFSNILQPAFASEKPYYDIESADTLFAEFVKTHNKSYYREEYERRYKIFLDTLKTINKLNEEYETVTFGINAYSDRTLEEKTARLDFTPNLDISQEQLADFPDMDDDIPESVDWRKKNAVNPIKNQGNCGSCWAFGAAAVIESQQAIKYNKLLSLSEQQLVDCDYNSLGCSGGGQGSAFTYAAQAGGMMLESDYPYKAEDADDCAFNSTKVVVKVLNGTLYKTLTEDKMAKLVAYYGPISIAMEFTPDLFNYKSGVIIPKDCDDTGIQSHSLAVVGYGNDKGSPYWLIRNSWGTTYGEEGYLRMYRGKALCSITRLVATVKIE